MSVKVELSELAHRLDEYGFAYLVTVNDDGRAHVLSVTPTLGEGGIVVDAVGRHTIANVGSNPVVTLVWPPVVASGYSLIVDGTAAVVDSSSGASPDGGGTVTVAPIKAILHRPAPGADGQRVGNDCVNIPVDG